jgi:hypothetical protein
VSPGTGRSPFSRGPRLIHIPHLLVVGEAAGIDQHAVTRRDRPFLAFDPRHDAGDAAAYRRSAAVRRRRRSACRRPPCSALWNIRPCNAAPLPTQCFPVSFAVNMRQATLAIVTLPSQVVLYSGSSHISSDFTGTGTKFGRSFARAGPSAAASNSSA